MTTITLDPKLRGALPDLSQPFAVCDEAGNIVGRYVPALSEPPMSREEIERRMRDKSVSYTTAEVLAYLEKL